MQDATDIAGKRAADDPAAREPSSCWYLLRTKPRGEEPARTNLERQGYRVYYPRVRERKLCREQWRDRISALFPSYLFLQIRSDEQSLAPVRSTTGVAEIVKFGGDYANVPADVVQGLMKRADSHTGLHELKTTHLRPGTVVRVIAGAFAGIDGIFERALASDRIVVLFSLLGREAPVHVPAQFVVPASP